MKPKHRNPLLAAFISFTFAAPSAQAVDYYWDNNGTTTGYGTAGGTWAAPTVSQWSTSNVGTATPGASITTATTDTVNFGLGTTGNGLAAGTITVSGSVSTGNMTFGSLSGAITLSGGIINLGGSRTITANNANNVITSEIALSGASIFQMGEIGASVDRQLTLGVLSGTGGTTFQYTGGTNGRGIILLNGASTYTGNTLISTSATNARTELRLGVVNALPTTTILTIGGAAGSGSGRTTDLNMNGQNQTLAGLATTGGGALRTQNVFSSAAAILTINDSGNRTFAGLIGNGGTNVSVTKQGAGIWTLSGANTYVGQTKVEAGTITVSNATALGGTAGNTVVSSGGRIFTGTTSISIAEAFNIAGAGPSGTTGAINIGGSATGVAFTGAITLAGNATIQGDGGTGTTFSGGINLGANVLTFKESGTITVSTAAISGTGGSIVKTTGGQLNLNFANTYTGNTTVNAGILSLGNSTAAGVGGTINLGDTTGTATATLTLTGTTNVANALTVRTGSSGTKTISNASAGSTTYSGNIAADDNLTVLGAMTGTSTFTISGTGNSIAAGKTVSFSNTSASSGLFTDSALWSGDGATSYTGTSNASSLAISGAKTYTGGSTIGLFSGTAALAVVTSSVGSGAGVTSGAFGTGTLTLANGAKIRSTTNADTTVGNTLTLAGDIAASTVSGEKSLIFSGPATLTGTRTFDVSIGNNVASKSLTFSGAIGESGGAQGITKTGTGNMLLSGDNSYTGATLISAGTLTLSGAGDINSSSGITINGSGAKFLQTSSVASTPSITLTQGTLTGSGTVDTVGVADTVNAVISNNNGVAGASLTIGALTFNGAATVNTFSNSTSAPIITTSLDSNAAGSVIINPTAASWASGSTYDLISYGSIGGAGLGQFALGAVTGLTVRQTTTFGNSANAITLGISGDIPVWSGLGATTWTTAAANDNTGPNDWALKTANTATNFWATDGVEFKDTYDIGGGPTAVTNSSVTITGGVAPSATVFDNSAVNYTVTSSDATGITSGSLTKSGSGSVSINTNNTYSGGTTITGGTLTAAKNAATLNSLGTGAVSIASGSTLVIDLLKTTNVTDTIANTFTGDGLLKLQFAADVLARNTSMPNVTGFSGTIQLSNLGTTGDKWNAASLGTVAGSLLVDSGSTIFVQTAPASFTGGITINGAGSSEARGAIRLGATSLGGNITLASSSTISMESTASALLTGAISSGAAGTQTLTLGGTGSTGGTLSGVIGGGTGTIAITQAVGSYTLSGDNTYTGETIVNSGNLSITHNNALGSTAGATTVNGGNTTTGFGLSLTAATTGLSIAENINLFGNVSGRAQVLNNSAQNHTFTGAIDVSSDTNLAQFNSGGSGSITISGDISGTMANGAVLFLRGTSTSATNQVIGNVNLTGGNLAKTDAGTWLVGAAGKTYSWNDTLVAVGTLKMGLAGVLPSTTGLILGNSTGASTGSLDLNGFNQTVASISYNGAGVSTGTRAITNSDLVNPATLILDNATDNPSLGTNVATNNVVFTGNLGLTKQGAGSLILPGVNTHTGATLVSAGTLYVTGSLTASAVTVEGAGTIGRNSVTAGKGLLGNGLTIQAGGNLDLTGATLGLDSTGILSITGGSLTLANLTFQDIVGWDWFNADNGTYELIDGSFSVDFGTTAFISEATAYHFGNGKMGYFTSGSLNAVIIPEPSTALLGALGALMLLRRRR